MGSPALAVSTNGPSVCTALVAAVTVTLETPAPAARRLFVCETAWHLVVASHGGIRRNPSPPP